MGAKTEDVDPRRASIYLDNLSGAYRDGEHALNVVPGHVKKILREGLWRRRYCKPTGQTVTFDSFRDFATAPPPEGLGADLDTLVALCQNDPGALDLLRQHGIE
jgi:hypothetical protein